jgi:hypothetical protein
VTWSAKKYAEHNRQLLLRDEFIIPGKCYDLLQRTGETQVKVVPQKSSHRLRILNRRGRNGRVEKPESPFPPPQASALIVRRSDAVDAEVTAVAHLQCRSLTSFKNESTIYRAESTSWTLSYHCFVKHFQMAADVMVMKNKTPRAWRPLSRSVRLSKEKILSQDQPSDLTIHSIGPAPTSTTRPSGCGVW